jgi:hypothetical protein
MCAALPTVYPERAGDTTADHELLRGGLPFPSGAAELEKGTINCRGTQVEGRILAGKNPPLLFCELEHAGYIGFGRTRPIRLGAALG